MTELYEFAMKNWMLFSAWIVIAVGLIVIQLRSMATGPKSITTQVLTNLVNRHDGVIIDIRGQADFNKGHIQGALNFPLSKIKESAKDLEKYKERPIIMVCANGISVNGACGALKKEGFEQLNKLAGGMASWVGDNLPVVKS